MIILCQSRNITVNNLKINNENEEKILKEIALFRYKFEQNVPARYVK